MEMSDSQKAAAFLGIAERKLRDAIATDMPMSIGTAEAAAAYMTEVNRFIEAVDKEPEDAEAAKGTPTPEHVDSESLADMSATDLRDRYRQAHTTWAVAKANESAIYAELYRRHLIDEKGRMTP